MMMGLCVLEKYGNTVYIPKRVGAVPVVVYTGLSSQVSAKIKI
jgi:hypothetical protein